MGKLSKTQIDVLKRLAEPGNLARYQRYMGTFSGTPYWFYQLYRGRVRCVTMNKLLGLTLVKLSAEGEIARITDKGRAALAELEGKP